MIGAKTIEIVHLNLWESGHYLLLINVISVFLCFLPLILPFGDIGNMRSPSSIQPVLDAMHSSDWKSAIVGCVGVSVPMIVEFILDAIISVREGSLNKMNAPVPRLVLICSLLIPNMLNLLVSIPMKWVELTTCLFMIRNNMMICAVFGHLWIEGGPAFQSIWFVMTDVIASTGLVLCCWAFISTSVNYILFWLAEILCNIAIAMALVIAWRHLRIIWKYGFQQMSIDQLSCVLYLTALCVYGMVVVVISILFVDDHGPLFLCLYTYTEAAFTVAVFVIKVRLTTYALALKEVNSYLCIFQNTSAI
jgi:hypothetical protein